MPHGLTIRPAVPSDTALILSFIRQLAEYERLADQVEATEAELHKWLFCDQPVARVLIAEYSGEAAGFALFFHNFSTFLSKPGIFLEDLYVRPSSRGKGIGKALLTELVKLAHQEGCGRVEWAVLDWNAPAIDFYKSLGARPMSDWTIFRLDRAGIKALAEGDEG
ncbi:MAG: GNAT family N-acetyltransferase [Acidobacteria bacterium]|nr:MAG: GNAT family N-acetyltransferase [Acidobacteriota bacterium]